MPEYQGKPNITENTRCWAIIVAYDLTDGQALAGKEDWLEQFQELTFAEAEQKAQELNQQLRDNT